MQIEMKALTPAHARKSGRMLWDILRAVFHLRSCKRKSEPWRLQYPAQDCHAVPLRLPASCTRGRDATPLIALARKRPAATTERNAGRVLAVAAPTVVRLVQRAASGQHASECGTGATSTSSSQTEHEARFTVCARQPASSDSFKTTAKTARVFSESEDTAGGAAETAPPRLPIEMKNGSGADLARRRRPDYVPLA
ncbi:hypothetical protein FA95DRAFT_1578179 [Auriscalpium vulgare]|uniref:Uncharacterized protein n=1 Tax=Auriscalpium vulgare TaxID=40419 RepID=A0ACB8R379_9AGAM|nr:hypothetical protein FA95DRAFT_1578179 [Auriscalpium vulgare]